MGREFDRLCTVMERHLSGPAEDFQRRNPGAKHKFNPIETLRRARLFYFDEPVASPIYSAPQDVDVQFTCDSFFLPFDVTAVEEDNLVSIIWDQVEGQRGLNVQRKIMTCLSWGSSYRGGSPGGGVKDDVCVIFSGTAIGASVVPGDTWLDKLRILVSFDYVMYVSKTRGVERVLTGAEWDARWDAQESHVESRAFLVVPFQLIVYMNTPGRFVVRESPFVPSVSVVQRKGRIKRSHERDRYILLKPHEIRERFGIRDEPVNEHASPSPHWRRRHYRTLRSDRYKNAQGRTLIIPATWVGPEEGEYRGRRYKVCLDL